MPDYRESEVAGKSWRRAYAVTLRNPYGEGLERTVTFSEEDVITLPGLAPIHQVVGDLGTIFDPGASFPLINPNNGTPLGQDMNQGFMYVALHSLYMHLAQQRDNPPPAPPVVDNYPVTPPQPPETENEQEQPPSPASTDEPTGSGDDAAGEVQPSASLDPGAAT